MGTARIQAAACEVNRLSELCTQYLEAQPRDTPLPPALLRELAAAARCLIVAIGDHVTHTQPVSRHGE